MNPPIVIVHLSLLVAFHCSQASFLSTDPQHVNPNPFAYCHNIPSSYTDRSGERPIFLTDWESADQYLPREMDINYMVVRPHETLDKTIARELDESFWKFKDWNGHLDISLHGSAPRSYLDKVFGLNKEGPVYMTLNHKIIAQDELARTVRTLEHYSLKMNGSRLKSINLFSCYFSRPSNPEFQHFVSSLHQSDVFEFKRDKLTKKLMSKIKPRSVFLRDIELTGNTSILTGTSIFGGFVRFLAKPRGFSTREFISMRDTYYHPHAVSVGQPIESNRQQIPDFDRRFHTVRINSLERIPE